MAQNSGIMIFLTSNLRLLRGINSTFLINRNAAKEKIRKRNGENINSFFNNVAFGLFR